MIALGGLTLLFWGVLVFGGGVWKSRKLIKAEGEKIGEHRGVHGEGERDLLGSGLTKHS